MNSTLLILSWLLPLLLVPLATRLHHAVLLTGAGVPALLTVFLVPLGSSIEITWLLLGTQLGIDASGRLLLLGSAVVWISAAFYAGDDLRGDPRAGRFRLFFLPAMAGNFLLIVAQDALGFYVGYALMGIAAFGLVGHHRSTTARRAARSYLRWTLAGELLLFCALVLMAAGTGAGQLGFAQLQTSGISDGVMLLLVLAFGIKLAVVGLHLWQPLAYPAAPPAAAAVLSGAMINAGLLGWMHFLPIGETGHADWGYLLIGAGLVSTFYGVAIGLLQQRAKVVLAYSSMSQMGLLTAGIGLALAEPTASDALLLALTFYALHHGLAKAALFLLVDAHARNAGRWTFVLLVVFALVLAGVPLSSGAVAKTLYKTAVPDNWAWLTGVLLASSIATTLLMARFLFLAHRRPAGTRSLAWRSSAALLLPLLSGAVIGYTATPLRPVELALSGIGPLLVGAGIALIVMRIPPLARGLQRMHVPPGDIPLLLVHAARRRLAVPDIKQPSLDISIPPTGMADWLRDSETYLRRWSVSGAGWLLLCVGILALLIV